MPSSIIVAAIASSAGIAAGTLAYAALSFAVTVVTTYVVSSLFLRKGDQNNQGGDQPAAGNRVQLPPATNNKLPAVYGRAWLKAIITDAKISTDQKTMWYVCALTDVSDFGPGMYGGGQISFGRVMWGDKTLNFDDPDDPTLVDSWTNDANEIDYAVRGKMNVYLYRDGSSSPTNTTLSAITVLSDDKIAENQKWDYDGQNNLMTKTAFAIVKVQYDQDIGLTGISTLTVETINSQNTPGGSFYDYLSNPRYGCAIPPEQIDMASFQALDAYAAQEIPVEMDGSTVMVPRYQFNGLADTNQDCATVLQHMSDSCDTWLQWNEATGKWSAVINQPYVSKSDLKLLDDDNIVGSIEFNPVDLNSTFNRVEATYPDTNIYDQTGYAYVDLDEEDFNPNEPDNLLSITLPFVNVYYQAYYLATRRLLQSREDLVVKLTTNASGIQIDAGDLVRINNDKFKWEEKVFRVTQVIESKNNEILQAQLTLTEYNEQVYQGIDIMNYVPSPNTGITDPNIAQPPSTPTIDNEVTTATIPSFRLNSTVPAGRGVYQSIEFWYSPFPNQPLTYIPLKTIDAPTGTTFTNGSVVSFVVTGLTPGLYGFKARVLTSTGVYSSFSNFITYPWSPSLDVPVSAATVFDWQPDTIIIPADSTGEQTAYAQPAALQLRIGQSIVPVWDKVSPVTQPNNSWYANTLIAGDGVVLSPLVLDSANNWANFVVGGIENTYEQSSATITDVFYKPAGGGNLINIGTTSIEITKLRGGDAGSNGANGYTPTLNQTSISFQQASNGAWPTSTAQYANITYFNGQNTFTKSQLVTVSNTGNVIFGANTGSGNIQVINNGNNTPTGSITFTLNNSYPVGLPVTTIPGTGSWSVSPAQLFFNQNSNGTYGPPTTQQAVFKFTPTTGGGATTEIQAVATVAGNGVITLSTSGLPTGFTSTISNNNSKIVSINVTHTTSNTSTGIIAYSITAPYVTTNPYDGVIINYGNAYNGNLDGTARVAGSPTVVATYSANTGSIFSRAPDSGNWTPPPNASNVITTKNTIEIQRNGVLLARMAQNISYNTVSKTFSATFDSAANFNANRFTFSNTNVSSSTQYYVPFTYRDSPNANINLGTAVGAFQITAVEGGSRGAPGPVNVVRYARFNTRNDAQIIGSPTTANGLSNTSINPNLGYEVAVSNLWYRTPDVFPANAPFTHTSTQFVANVTAGSPAKWELNFTGTGGGGYEPGLNETWTQRVANNHVTATFSTLNYGFTVTGNTGESTFPGEYAGGDGQAIEFGGATPATSGFFMPVFNASANTVIASQDGISWYPQTVTYTGFTLSSGGLNVNNATFFNGKWRAVVLAGYSGSVQYIAVSSTTGLSWTVDAVVNPSSSITNANTVRTYVVNGNMVAIGSNGFIAYSSNGTTWTNYALGGNPDLTYITYFNGYYVLFSAGATWSSTGLTGFVLRTNEVGAGSNGASVTQSPTRLVLLNNLTLNYYYSDDALTFTRRTPPSITINAKYPVNTLAYGSGTFVAPSIDGSVIYSTDGIAWTAGSGSENTYQPEIIFLNGVFFSYHFETSGGAGTSLGSSSMIYRSTDNGRSWTQIALPSTISGYSGDNTYPGGIYYGNNAMVIPTRYTDPESQRPVGSVMLSLDDGATWRLLSARALSIQPAIWYFTDNTGANYGFITSQFSLPANVTNTVQLTANLISSLQSIQPPDPVGGADLFQVNVDPANTEVGVITFKYTGSNLPLPGFTVTNSRYANLANISAVNVLPAGVSGGGAPSSLVIGNVRLATNRTQLQIIDPPVISSGAYTWNVRALTSYGSFTNNDAVIIDTQSNAAAPATEFSGVFSNTFNNGANIRYDAPNATISFTPSNWPTIQSTLEALSTDNLIFLQGTDQYSSNLYVQFASNSNSNSQALQIAQAFNTQEVAYLATVSGNTVTLTSSVQINQPDLYNIDFITSNGNAQLTDFRLTKVQDGRAPGTISFGTPETIILTKLNTFGRGSVSVTLDYGANWTTTQNPNVPNVQTSLQSAFEDLGFYVIKVDSDTWQLIDVDPTGNAKFGAQYSLGSGPVGTFSINNGNTANVLIPAFDNGVIEIVNGDPLRWTRPVNTGQQIQ